MGLKQSKFKCLQGESDGKTKRQTSKKEGKKKTESNDFEFDFVGVKKSDDVKIGEQRGPKTRDIEIKTDRYQKETNIEVELNTKTQNEAKIEAELNSKNKNDANIEAELNSKNKNDANIEAELNIKNKNDANIEDELNIKNKNDANIEAELNIKNKNDANIEAELNSKNKNDANIEAELNSKNKNDANIEAELNIKNKNDANIEDELSIKNKNDANIEDELSPDSNEITDSEKLRNLGNNCYKSAMAKGLAPVLALSRLHTAYNLYTRALKSSPSDDESSSAAKNLGMTSWKLGMVIFNKDKDMNMTCRHFRDAFKQFKSAVEYGTSCKSASWTSKLETSCERCWNDFHLCVSEIAMEQRIRSVNAVLPFLSSRNQIYAYLKIANVQFHVGINAFQKGDFKKCMYQMSECHHPIEKVKELRGNDGAHDEIQSLEQDIVMHMSIAESAQSRQTGDDLLKMVLKDEETLNIEMVWAIIDWYRQAIVLTRDLDMEMEAIALSRLGVVYDKVLKLKPKAKEYFMNSVRLAESMHPRTFNTTDWYIVSTGALKRYQEETVQHEEEEKTKERAEIKEKMKEELDALDKDHKNMKNKEFLKHLYNKYKPKNPAHIFEDFDETEDVQTKKRLQKAILHFHPDKVDAEEHSWEWKIMTEEITKYLTKRYEIIKAEI